MNNGDLQIIHESWELCKKEQIFSWEKETIKRETFCDGEMENVLQWGNNLYTCNEIFRTVILISQ